MLLQLLLGEAEGGRDSELRADSGASIYLFNGSQMYIAHRGVRTRVPEGFLRQACVHPEVGLFSVVSQVSPTGSPSLEDLALLDPSDPKQWLLAVVTHRDGDYVIYRRLYRVEG